MMYSKCTQRITIKITTKFLVLLQTLSMISDLVYRIVLTSELPLPAWVSWVPEHRHEHKGTATQKIKNLLSSCFLPFLMTVWASPLSSGCSCRLINSKIWIWVSLTYWDSKHLHFSHWIPEQEHKLLCYQEADLYQLYLSFTVTVSLLPLSAVRPHVLK